MIAEQRYPERRSICKFELRRWFPPSLPLPPKPCHGSMWILPASEIHSNLVRSGCFDRHSKVMNMVGVIIREAHRLDYIIYPDANGTIVGRTTHRCEKPKLLHAACRAFMFMFRQAMCTHNSARELNNSREVYRASRIEIAGYLKPRTEEAFALACIDIIIVGPEAIAITMIASSRPSAWPCDKTLR